MTIKEASAERGIRSLVPARIDRLGWSRFHTRMVIALGVAWILDGLEVSIASTVSSYMTEPSALNMSNASVAFSVGTIYLLGEVFGGPKLYSVLAASPTVGPQSLGLVLVRA